MCGGRGVGEGGGFPLECAAAQVFQEAGVRVATNVLVRDMDLGEFNALERRLEMVGWLDFVARSTASNRHDACLM